MGLTPALCNFAVGAVWAGQCILLPHVLQPRDGGFPIGSTHGDIGAEPGVCDPSRGDITVGEPPGQHADGNRAPASSWRFELVLIGLNPSWHKERSRIPSTAIGCSPTQECIRGVTGSGAEQEGEEALGNVGL